MFFLTSFEAEKRMKDGCMRLLCETRNAFRTDTQVLSKQPSQRHVIQKQSPNLSMRKQFLISFYLAQATINAAVRCQRCWKSILSHDYVSLSLSLTRVENELVLINQKDNYSLLRPSGQGRGRRFLSQGPSITIWTMDPR